MYEYKKRPSKIKRFFLIIFLMIVASCLSVFVYSMYTNMDINPENNNQNNSAVRLSQNIKEDEGKEDITDVLDKTIKCVVGISKIKNTGNSIFLNDSTKELGLGTGIILTDNRIYPY